MLVVLVLAGTSVASTTGGMRMAHLTIALFAGAVLVWTLFRSPKNDT